jgi:hypothetical protein
MSEQVKGGESTYVSVRTDDLNFLRNMAQRARLDGVDAKQYNEAMDRVMTAQEAAMAGVCAKCEGEGYTYAVLNGHDEPSEGVCAACDGTGCEPRDAYTKAGQLPFSGLGDDEAERLSLEQLAELEREYRRLAAPYVGTLTAIAARKPPSPMILSIDNLSPALLNRIRSAQ